MGASSKLFLEMQEIQEEIFEKRTLQFRENNCEQWRDCIVFEYRLKPQPNFDKEIEAIQEKAKNNGMKAIITFEKLW